MYPSKLDTKSTGIEELCIMQHYIFTMVCIYIQTYITNKQIPIDPVDFPLLYNNYTSTLCMYVYIYIYMYIHITKCGEPHQGQALRLFLFSAYA